MTMFYEVRRRDGTLAAIHKRRDLPGGGKAVSWLKPDGSAGLNGTPVDALPLYGAHRLAEWPEPAPLVLVEGEKAAEALWRAGVPALATVTGAASAPSAEVLADLAGRSVLLWPDNDDAGRAHMATIAALLADVAAVAIVEWPDAPAKGDAADFVADGRTAADVLALLATATDANAVTWRTLADIDDSPPGPLLLDMLEPDGPNLLYAAPGVGKGMTGAYLVCQAQADGLLPMIYDAERRPREWARRVAGLGGDRSRVVYLAPAELGKAAGKPLWQAIDVLAKVQRAAGADLLLVDSVVTAVGVGEERLKSDARAPFDYVAALDGLGIPSVSFGHPPKGTPEGEPFGSMAWIAAMRLTWVGTRAEGSEAHRVRWRPRKRNERGHIPGLLLTFSYGLDGRPSAVAREDDDANTREWLLRVLADHEPRSVAGLAEELLADEDEHVTVDRLDKAKERLSRTLRRMARDGAVTREGPATGPKVQWRR